MVLTIRTLWLLGRYYRHTLFVICQSCQDLNHGLLERRKRSALVIRLGKGLSSSLFSRWR